LRAVVIVRVLELHRCGFASRDRDLLKHLGQRIGFEHREIPAFLALPRCPAEQRCLSSVDHLLDIRIGARLVELVIKRRHDVLPGRTEHRDAIGLAIDLLGIHPDRVINRLAADLDRTVIAAEPVERIGFLLLGHAPASGVRAVTPLGSAGCRIVVQHGATRQHEIEHRGAQIKAREFALGVELADQLLDVTLRKMGRDRAGELLRRHEFAGQHGIEILCYDIVQGGFAHRCG